MKPNDFVQNSVNQNAIDQNSNNYKIATGAILNNSAKQFSVLVATLDKSVAASLQVSKQLNILNNNFSNQLKELQNVANVATMKSQQNDIRYKEDPDKEMRLDIDSVDKTLKSMFALQKMEKKGSGLLSWIGAAMGIGGLVGYLLTGKSDFLMDTVKGLKWIGKSFILPFEMAKGAYKAFKSVVGIGDDVSKIGSVFLKSFDKVKDITKILRSAVFGSIGDIPKIITSVKQLFGAFKPLSEIVSEGSKLLKPLAKVTGFEGVKVTQQMAKTLKPLAEIMSEGSKLLKPIAEVATEGAKGFAIFKNIGSMFKGIGAGFKTVGKVGLKKIPILGAILGIAFGAKRFSDGDLLGGMLELASGFSPFLNVVPGLGLALGLAIDSYLIFRDFKMSDIEKKEQNKGFKKLGAAYLKSLPLIGPIININDGFKLWKTDKTAAFKKIGLALMELQPGVGGLVGVIDGLMSYFGGKKNEGIINGTVTSDIGGDKLGLGISDGSSKPINSSAEMEVPIISNFNPRSFVGFGSKYPGIGIYGNANFEGLNSSVKTNFLKMANEYLIKTGKNIQVNSAKRNGDGNSLHDKGLAIDIQSIDASGLESLGLMQKYGFHRPLLNWKTNDPTNANALNETWHIEPYPGSGYGERNTNNYEYRTAKLRDNSSQVVMSPTGDGGYGSSKKGNFLNKNGQKSLDLSDETISKLAVAIAENNKNKLNVSNRTIVTTTDGRSNF